METIETTEPLLTPKEYAKKMGVSPQSVYARIKRGTLTVIEIDGVNYIADPTQTTEETRERQQMQPSKQHLAMEIEQVFNLYEQQNATLQATIKQLNKRIAKLERKLDKKNAQIEKIYLRTIEEKTQKKRKKNK